MGKAEIEQQAAFRKWTLKEKINYIREVLDIKGFDVVLKTHSIEWVSRKSAEAGMVQMKFLQELGELDFDTKISHYFTLVTDNPAEKESATQRERRVRDDLSYYTKAANTLKLAGKKTSLAKKNAR